MCDYKDQSAISDFDARKSSPVFLYTHLMSSHPVTYKLRKHRGSWPTSWHPDEHISSFCPTWKRIGDPENQGQLNSSISNIIPLQYTLGTTDVLEECIIYYTYFLISLHQLLYCQNRPDYFWFHACHQNDEVLLWFRNIFLFWSLRITS